MALQQPTPLIGQLASKIVEHVKAMDEPHGVRLVERKLAEQLKVSRSPIRGALKVLEERGFVSLSESGGYLVSWNGEELPNIISEAVSEDLEKVYFSIADARLSGDLPDRVTENELVRRFNLTKSQLTRLLHRIVGEGWIARLPGHGWEFLPMLTSMSSYKESYRFRMTIEPAAILEPTFVLNREGIEDCVRRQQALIDGDIRTVSKSDLFDLNCMFHEAIIECSHNHFFIEALRRVDRVRRLFEYRQTLDRDKAVIRSREHVQLGEMLLDNRREEASLFMKLHLSSVSALKTTKAS